MNTSVFRFILNILLIYKSREMKIYYNAGCEDLTREVNVSSHTTDYIAWCENLARRVEVYSQTTDSNTGC